MLAAVSSPASGQVSGISCLSRTGSHVAGDTYTNSCTQAIKVIGARYRSINNKKVCRAFPDNQTINAGGYLYLAVSTRNGRLCFEYANARSHYDAGLKACSTVSENLTQCGGGPNNNGSFTVYTPGSIPSGSISLSSSQISLLEDGNAFPLRISLSLDNTDEPPESNVVINITSDNADVRISPASVTFTPSNYGTSQNISFNAPNDDDATDETGTITFEATISSGLSVANKTASVSVTDDDDTPSGTIQVTPSGTLTIDEGDAAGVTLSVRLSAAPNADVTVSLAKTNADVTLSPSSLTFTTANWSTAQNVTVKASHDDNDDDETDTITLSATGGIIAPNVTKTVTITDDDEAEFLLTTATLSLTAGDSGTFGVRLGTRPSADVTVTVTASNSSKLTIDTDPETPGNQGTLSFNQYGQTNAWNQHRTVTVTAVQDNDQNDESLTITLTGMGGDYQGKTATATVTYLPLGTIQVTPAGTLSINEGASANLSVRLSTWPSSNVTVSLAKTSTDVRLSPASLTFTPDNWNTAQTVTVSAIRDTDTTNDTDTITLSATGGISASNVTKAVTITDLGSNLPGAHECVEVTTSDNDSTFENHCAENVALYFKVTFSGLCINFSQNLSSGGTFADSRVNFPAKYCIEYQDSTHQANSGYQSSCRSLLTDCGTSGLTAVAPGTTSPLGTIQVTPARTLTINEGASTNLSVSLSTAPTSDVRVTLTELANTGVTVIDTDTGTTGNQNTLTFTTTNWGTAQSVTVSAAEDDDATDDTATIRLNASGGGYANATGSVMVNVTDDDEVKLNLSTTTLPVTEGSNATFTVSLDSVPSDDVTVTLTQPSNTDVTVDTNTSAANNQNTLTFTTADWNTAQSVTVSAAEDDDAIADTATIGLSASGGGYGSATGNVAVNITDNDSPGLTINPDTLSITEGSSGNFSVSLTTQPSENVTVTIAQPSNTDITVDTDSGTSGNQNTLSFTTGNYNTAQSVTVNVAEDADTANDNATLNITASGADYTSVTGSVSVTATDNDSAGLTINPDTLNITEGNSGNFTVSLTTQPSENVTVTIAQPSNTDITVDTDSGTSGNQNTLTFTTGNYNTAQSVTVNVAKMPTPPMTMPPSTSPPVVPTTPASPAA